MIKRLLANLLAYIGVPVVKACVLLILIVVAPVSRAADSSMAGYYELIYQIRVVARTAGSKSSIGSGFQISKDGLIITNYHVVAMAVNSPDTHSIEYLDQAGNFGELSLLDFDVVNDLAVLRHPSPAARHFELADASLESNRHLE